VVAFNSIIRAQLSLAWVFGPPISFGLALSFGFTVMYLTAMSMFIIAMFFVAIFLPSVEKNPTSQLSSAAELQAANIPLWKNRNVVCLLLSTVFMWTANMMYIIDMPLYVDLVLHLPDSLPGILMGLAAGIEIPVMLIAGSKKILLHNSVVQLIYKQLIFHFGKTGISFVYYYPLYLCGQLT
jgi:hypothetical protein